MTTRIRPTSSRTGPRRRKAARRNYIVSSADLAPPGTEELSELEYGLILLYNAFSRWIIRCMGAAGVPKLSALDILVLHHINHRHRGKSLSDLCSVLGIDDSHLVNYSLKKLIQLRLIVRKKPRKEVFYFITEKGVTLCKRYRQVREDCLIVGLPQGLGGSRDLGQIGRQLRLMSGVYDQAARSASSL